MSDENTNTDATADAAPKKPRAKKAATGDGAVANAASGIRTQDQASANDAYETPPMAQPASVPASNEQTPTPNSAIMVPSSVAAAGATVAAQSTGALSALTDKVSAMIPEDMTAKAKDAAVEVKTMACDAATGLARIIGDSAATIDDNIGPKYGDYARTAAQSVTEAADRLRAKPVEEIAEDTKQFVRNKPVAAAGIAAVFSVVVAKLLGSMFGKKR